MASFWTLILASLPLWTACLAQIQLANVSLPTNSSTTTTCITVINQAVTCDPVLLTLGRYDVSGISYFLTPDQLTTLCTTTCSAALATWERRIAGACGSIFWTQADGSQSAPAAIAEQYVELYNSACLKGSATRDGAYCNTVLASVLGIDPADGQNTAPAASTAPCNSCYLSLLQTQLEMPLASNTDIASLFTAGTSSCKSSGYSPSPTPTATTFTIPASTSSTVATCSGTTVGLSSSSTCLGISDTYGISTYDLLRQNGLPSLCYGFPTSGSICIPDSYTCETYVVQSGDTCSLLQREYGITFSQIIAWNPPLGTACGNIAQYVGYAICVSVPGGAWVNPSPTSAATTTTTGFATWTLPGIGSLPTAFDFTTNSTSTPALTPYANDTRLDCTGYVTTPVLTNFTANTTSLLCEDVVDLYSIELSDFVSWNPSLNTSSPCTMVADMQYCVQLSQTLAENITDACIGWETAPAGYDCVDFTSLLGLDFDQFVSWNLGVGENCTNFSAGTSYCTTVYHFRQAGIVSTCNRFTIPNNTNWVDQPCQIIETEYGISHARFVAWNPSVEDDCSGLYLGYDYCVSIPNYKPTYSTVTSTGLGTAWYPSSFQNPDATTAQVQGSPVIKGPAQNSASVTASIIPTITSSSVATATTSSITSS